MYSLELEIRGGGTGFFEMRVFEVGSADKCCVPETNSTFVFRSSWLVLNSFGTFFWLGGRGGGGHSPTSVSVHGNMLPAIGKTRISRDFNHRASATTTTQPFWKFDN